jgi:hypothetical protein
MASTGSTSSIGDRRRRLEVEQAAQRAERSTDWSLMS